jgi:hypothetical protein
LRPAERTKRVFPPTDVSILLSGQNTLRLRIHVHVFERIEERGVFVSETQYTVVTLQ